MPPPPIWLTDGRLTPAENTTGFQMEAFDSRPYFVSGVCCGLGRRFSKAKTLFPDWTLTEPDNPHFEPWAMMRFSRSGMTPEEVAVAFGARGDAVRAPGIEILADFIGESRGFTGVDRLDLYFAGGRARGWRCSGLDLAGTWLAPRAPFLTRRWIEAVLAGAPEERLDDHARLRLIRRINPAVARVPWVMTRLPLGPSELVLQGLRETSRLRRLFPGRGRAALGSAKAGDGATPSAVPTGGAPRTATPAVRSVPACAHTCAS